MIAHEAVGVDTMPEPFDPFLQKEIEASPVSISREDGLPGVAAEDDVIHRPKIVNSRSPSHGAIHPSFQFCKPDSRGSFQMEIKRIIGSSWELRQPNLGSDLLEWMRAAGKKGSKSRKGCIPT